MLLHHKRVGLVLRVFSPKPELVDQSVRQVATTIDRATRLVIEGKSVFSRIDVLVSADGRYGDTDCGDTPRALNQAIDGAYRNTYVSEVKCGDIFCGMLNYGVAHQMRDRIDYTM